MHRAGQLLRAWRTRQDPPLTVEQFADRYGFKTQTVFGWESKGRIARADAQRRFQELGIAQPADWIAPAAPEASARDADGSAHAFYDMHSHGFVRVATSTPKVRTADVAYNAAAILEEARQADDRNVDLVLYPELCLSSYAIDDLHLQAALLDAVEGEIARIVAATAELTPVLVIGAPLRHNG